jgi:[DsrC]-trisulfide reductase subunit J
MRGWSVLVALAAVLLPLAGAAAGRVPEPRFDVDNSTTCVAPRDEIRRVHPDLLKHRRDQTVHEGVRGGKASLEACIDCHAGRSSAASVTGRSDAFCQACHAYAGVQLDCFECHQPRRGSAVSVSTGGAAAR